MAEVLSQSEIDQLLSNMKTGADETDLPGGSSREAVPFDFRLPNRISKIQLRTIRNIHENFAESFSSYLMAKLQSIININVISVDQIYYSEYVLSVSNPAALFIFQIKDSDIKGVLEFSPDLALTLVDRLLGGLGENTKQSKIITPIEQKVLRSMVDRILKDLGKSWQMIDDFEFEMDRFEPDIDFAQITSQSESVLLITFEIFIGDQSYLMNLAFATYAFDSVLAKLSNQAMSTIRPVKYDGATAQDILVGHLNRTKLNVHVEFGKSQITLGQLMQLEIGDIIEIDKKIGDEVSIKIENKQIFYGLTGNSNGTKAVKITRRIEKEGDGNA